MAAESPSDFDLEIAHVLFMDIVGYSRGLIDQQRDLLNELNKIVRETQQFKSAEAAGKLIRLPTGDGMALAFFTNPEAPLKCAIEVSEAVGQAFPPAGEKRGQAGTLALHLRMGIHSGPVSGVTDVNDRTNVAGVGINIAQRVMDCGDAGHILLSKRIAEDLAQYGRWRAQLHELGQVEVKHGVKIDVVNFYADGIGNAAVPEKIALKRKEQATTSKTEQARSRATRRIIEVALLLAAMLMIGLVIFAYRAARKSITATAPSAANVVPEKSIAVLPLENLSEEKENAFFADGIQDDILTSLAQIGDLKVISRTSVMQYRSAARNLREIANALGVANILEGSVRRSGNRVLVNVQLIDARNDRHIWARHYDRTIADSIGLQGELATEIAAALQARLAPQEKATLDAKPTQNSEAYVLYLEARTRESGIHDTSEAEIDAERLYAQAIALDPKFALAHARASLLCNFLYIETDDTKWLEKARSYADEALRLAPTLGEAHLALGRWLFRKEKDYPAALKEYSIAAKALPNNAEVLTYSAFIYRRQGRWREAITGLERAESLDPRNPLVVLGLARTNAWVRNWSGAYAGFNRLLNMAPDSVDAKIQLAYVGLAKDSNVAAAQTTLKTIPAGIDPGGTVTFANWEMCMMARDFAGAEKFLDDSPLEEIETTPKTLFRADTAQARGDLAKARSLYEKMLPIFEGKVRDQPDNARHHAELGVDYALLGRKEDAIRECQRSIELVPEEKDAFKDADRQIPLATVYALTGEQDQAINLIERLLSKPCTLTLVDLRLRWEWDPLRTNPRFQKILAAPEPKTIYN
jgi:TolB-like protein/class 3 adenylate cyclase